MSNPDPVFQMLPALRTFLEDGRRLHFCSTAGSVDPETLSASERIAVADASPGRRREFATGRWCARRALGLAGEGNLQIPMGPDRAPVWPGGWTGSISHTRGCCAALLCERGGNVGVGIDVERADSGSQNLDRAFNAGELRGLSTPLEKLIAFSAKESFFKAASRFAGGLIGFDAVAIRLCPLTDSFRATLLETLGAGLEKNRAYRGRIRRERAFIFTRICVSFD
jgi:4'-phosphopantetheinyl transferase EntD